MTNQEQLQFEVDEISTSEELALNPKGYTGLYSFHKYWGKKPSETIGFLIEKLSDPNDIVCDPFVGSGVVVVEALSRSRRAIGIDLNPIAIEITKFLVNPPSTELVKSAFLKLKSQLQAQINESYAIQQPSRTASHYLWRDGKLESVWTKNPTSRFRVELAPQESDVDLSLSFDGYRPRLFRQPLLFNNSRINTSSNLQTSDLFTGRALRNIELILDAVLLLPSPLKETFLLCLTASSGQMSRMVFAITNRGKTTGNVSTRIEVGSWVIGYWRPKLNFEVNVWNCYEGKVTKLIKSLSQLRRTRTYSIADTPSQVLQGDASASIVLGDALATLKALPPDSLSLIVSDPPHSDRIPYLELSEMWNVILGAQSDFEKEIVVSNALGRKKGKYEYNLKMSEFLDLVNITLKPGGVFALIYNARDAESWRYFNEVNNGRALRYAGYLPLKYSANSVVQDNREGSLENDFVLVFTKGFSSLGAIKSTKGWSSGHPHTNHNGQKNDNDFSDRIESVQE
ncbi:MAG: DNA adenine methylase [Ignavibacteriae bacterium]|nr:DNA adenine methylase [Ignavibacteriota bacterium]